LKTACSRRGGKKELLDGNNLDAGTPGRSTGASAGGGVRGVDLTRVVALAALAACLCTSATSFERDSWIAAARVGSLYRSLSSKSSNLSGPVGNATSGAGEGEAASSEAQCERMLGLANLSEADACFCQSKLQRSQEGKKK